MTLAEDFEQFCKEIQLDNLNDMKNQAAKIAKKLNKHYYGIDGDDDSHMYIVGSVGRGTAIKGSSDLDLIFDLPNDVYKQFDAYKENGQSALLQDVKKVMQESYPRTTIRGDGQVVVIEFDKYRVELVPGFKQNDGSFKYPDTHDSGSWKYTNPIIEQKECSLCNDKSYGVYYDFCHIMRSWKNTIGFKWGGLLIDTLVYNFFKKNDWFAGKDSNDYLEILKNLFEYLKNQDKSHAHWYALGSNQKIYGSRNEKFVVKAEKAYKELQDITEADKKINDVLRSLLGKRFPKIKDRSAEFSTTEQFIEDFVPVDIRYDLEIDCLVTQDGWRPFKLRKFLQNNTLLRHKKKLTFFIKDTSNPSQDYDIWWKVRNVGEVAIERSMTRGQLIRSNEKKQVEHTNFRGPHYVECYLLEDGICVARDRIEVPIGNE
ncbi:nucleotide-binding domain-containing protein [Alloscardovia macacae]|uniref:Adenylyl/Guanylyl and SMODS C-terminal sensor domain-containing protein n=1 Tax=Alloscardovia macacae TaxID=1160091 RepID=A0A261F263_9BIFI|nr:nucleotidyltransferase domain-containing protein [Alloscardovia macacae]OZG53209.1 hypothetical protein ALMA_1511 [Alloscardovia macacae]